MERGYFHLYRYQKPIKARQKGLLVFKVLSPAGMSMDLKVENKIPKVFVNSNLINIPRKKNRFSKYTSVCLNFEIVFDIFGKR